MKIQKPKTIIALVVLLLSMLMMSCEELDITKDRRNAHDILHQNFKIWKSLDLKHYIYSQKKDCFCIYPPYAMQDGWYTVEVEYIEGVERPKISVNGDEVFDLPKGYAGVLMIEHLFELVHDEIQEDYFQFNLEFNKTYGFPSYFYIDKDEMLVDEEYSYSIKDFRVIN